MSLYSIEKIKYSCRLGQIMIGALFAGAGIGFFVQGLWSGTNVAWTYISPTNSTLQSAVESKLPEAWRGE